MHGEAQAKQFQHEPYTWSVSQSQIVAAPFWPLDLNWPLPFTSGHLTLGSVIKGRSDSYKRKPFDTMFSRDDIFRYRYICKDVRFMYVCMHTCVYIYIYVHNVQIHIDVFACSSAIIAHIRTTNICGKIPAWWTCFVCPDGLLMTWKFRLDMNPGIQSSWNPPEPTGLGLAATFLQLLILGEDFRGEAQPFLKLPRAKLSYIRIIDLHIYIYIFL